MWSRSHRPIWISILHSVPLYREKCYEGKVVIYILFVVWLLFHSLLCDNVLQIFDMQTFRCSNSCRLVSICHVQLMNYTSLSQTKHISIYFYVRIIKDVDVTFLNNSLLVSVLAYQWSKVVNWAGQLTVTVTLLWPICIWNTCEISPKPSTYFLSSVC
jgi:hypothetical protein